MENNENKAVKLCRMYDRAKASVTKERAVWDKCYGYVNNWYGGEHGQWDKDVRSELKAQGKPTISFNEIKKFVNRICGSQRQTKIDEKAFARDDESDPQIAEIMTDLLKYARHVNNAEHAFSRAFRDEVIVGQGWVKVEWNDDLDPMGEISISPVNPRRVYVVGEGERYDLKDRAGLLEVIPMDEDEIIKKWPDSEEDIKNLKYSLRNKEEIPVAGDYDYGAIEGSITPEQYFDEESEKFLVLRLQEYKYKDAAFLVDPATGQLKEIPGDQPEMAVQLIQTQLGIPVQTIKKRKRYVHVTYGVGNVELDDAPAPYKHDRFDLVGFFAYMDDGVITGIVQDLLDPQDEKNKRHSQLMHILGTSAKNSYFSKMGAFSDINDARKRISKIGEIIEVQGNPNEALVPIEGNFSAVGPIVQMEMMSTNEMKEISGLHDAALGKVPNQVRSGVAIQELQQPSETIVAEFFDNYLNSRKLVSELCISLMQQFYTTERRVRILGDYSPSNLTPQMEQQIMQGTLSVEEGAKIITINKQQLEQRLNDVTVGRFDIAIDHVSQNPTTRREQFQAMLNMRSMGIPISDEMIIEASDVRNKQAIISDLQRQRMLMMQMAAMQGPTPPKNPTRPNEGINRGGAQSPMG